MEYLSVFEQFELVGGYYLQKHLLLPAGIIIVVGILLRSGKERKLISSLWYWSLGQQYELVSNMVSKVGEGYGKWLFLIYLLILGLNLLGLLPFSYALTSQLIVTLFLGLGMWLGKLKVGIVQQGWQLFAHFLPVGLPVGLGPFFVLIELIGFLIPLISISVRLFANILSGHVLVHVLLGFIWLGFVKGLGWLVISPGFFLLMLVGLEWGVAFIQAYVFVLLVSVYLGEVDY